MDKLKTAFMAVAFTAGAGLFFLLADQVIRYGVTFVLGIVN